MGFLQKAQERKAELESKSLNTSACPSFSELIKSNNLSRVILLSRINQVYVIAESFGLDGDSICNCWATSDYWEATINTKNTWLSISKNDSLFQSFNQFFSDSIITEINTINIFYSDDFILLICNSENYDGLEEKFGSLINKNDSAENSSDENIQTNICLDLEEAVSAFTASKNSNYIDSFTSCILKEAHYKLCEIFNAEVLYKDASSPKKKFNYALNEDFPVELFMKHIIVNLSFIIGKSAELINISIN